MKSKSKMTKVIIVVSVFFMILVLGVCLAACGDSKKIKFTIEDTLPKGEGRKARVILLAGQSNAVGCSLTSYLEKNVSPEEYAAYAAGYDNVYINVFSSGRNVSNGFVRTSTDQGEPGGYFGPEVGLAATLAAKYPNELFFIVKFAWSGTNLFEQWRSPTCGNTGYLYKNFVRYTEKSLKYLKKKGYEPEIESICWMQGESDSFSVYTAMDYEGHLKNFMKDLRSDFSRYAAPKGIAFIDAEIAANPVYWVYCDLVNASKREVAASSEMNVLIDTNAAGLCCDQEPEESPDIPHYDSLSQIKLGNLFAEEVIKFLE